MVNSETNPDSLAGDEHPIVTWGARLTAAGLILLGLHVAVPDLAAWGYGIEPLDDNGEAYLIAAGVRDFSLGLMTLYLLRQYRGALGVFFLFMLVIPVFDTILVLRYATEVWKIFPHATGVIGLAVISFFAFREQRGLSQ